MLTNRRPEGSTEARQIPKKLERRQRQRPQQSNEDKADTFGLPCRFVFGLLYLVTVLVYVYGYVRSPLDPVDLSWVTRTEYTGVFEPNTLLADGVR